jgi:hypothetical protein
MLAEIVECSQEKHREAAQEILDSLGGFSLDEAIGVLSVVRAELVLQKAVGKYIDKRVRQLQKK